MKTITEDDFSARLDYWMDWVSEHDQPLTIARTGKEAVVMLTEKRYSAMLDRFNAASRAVTAAAESRRFDGMPDEAISEYIGEKKRALHTLNSTQRLLLLEMSKTNDEIAAAQDCLEKRRQAAKRKD